LSAQEDLLCARFMRSPATGWSEDAAMFDLIFGAIIAAGLFGYLLYALLNPEHL